jgi:hypothetical protein
MPVIVLGFGDAHDPAGIVAVAARSDASADYDGGGGVGVA